MTCFNSHKMKLIAGNASKELATKIAECLGTELVDCQVDTFSDGEIAVTINETIRGCDVFVIQSTSSPVNNNLMELLILIDALKRASVGSVAEVFCIMGMQDKIERQKQEIQLQQN